MTEPSILFTPFDIKHLTLKNRITMAPLFLGYANADGTVSPLLLDHYKEMAASGAALIVVENAAVDPSGLGSPFTIRVDHDRFLPGLHDLARIIHEQGALAFLQINHAGRYAFTPERLAPSPFKTGDVLPREMSLDDIERMVEAFGEAAGRVKAAGFDGVEIHGGTGYLIVQFLSPRTNLRQDGFGGSLEDRMRFPLMVVERVIEATGGDYPVGYRFLADEELPEGLHPEETGFFARELQKRGPAYLSVMAGTYDSFFLPQYLEKEKEEAARGSAIEHHERTSNPYRQTGTVQLEDRYRPRQTGLLICTGGPRRADASLRRSFHKPLHACRRDSGGPASRHHDPGGGNPARCP